MNRISKFKKEEEKHKQKVAPNESTIEIIESTY
jgi:hypothetical protein